MVKIQAGHVNMGTKLSVINTSRPCEGLTSNTCEVGALAMSVQATDYRQTRSLVNKAS